MAEVKQHTMPQAVPTVAQPVVTQAVKTVDSTSMRNVKKHKTLGEYVTCIVHPTRHAQQNTSIFASINMYSVDIKPETEVSIPQAIVDLLKNAETITHKFDPQAISEQGNKGAHLSIGVKKYIVEKV